MTKEELIALGVEDATAQKIAEAFAAQTTALQTQLTDKDKAHAAEIKQMKIDAAVTTALTAAKVKNPRAVKALLDGLDKAELAEDGTVKGLAEQIKKLQTAEDSKFLFESGETKPVIRGAKPGESGNEPPDGRVDASKMSYEELAAYMDANPNVKF